MTDEVATGTVDCSVSLWAQFMGLPAMMRFFTSAAAVAWSAAGDAIATGSADGQLVRGGRAFRDSVGVGDLGCAGYSGCWFQVRRAFPVVLWCVKTRMGSMRTRSS